jgi:signal transduction histidine kinase
MEVPKQLEKRKFLGGFNRYRLMLTLGLAVLLPAAALIYVNFSQLRSFERDKVVEAAIHRNFQEMLFSTEKKITKKAYSMIDDVREMFPSPDASPQEKEKQLDLVLAKTPWATHAMLYEEKSFIVRTQPDELSDRFVHEERDRIADMFHGWFNLDGKSVVERLHKKSRPINISAGPTKRSYGEAYLAYAFFVLPDVPNDRVAIGIVCFDPCYLKNTFFPAMLAEQVDQQSNEQGPNRMAMIVYPSDMESGYESKPIAATTGWDGKPEVSRKFDSGFVGLTLGIRYQGVSVEALGKTWMHRSFLILGILSVLMIGGLVLTKHVVSKEMAVAKLKSDFVSNVSHELRTPLALIRLYAETLELGRITTKEKKHQYYRIIRKESERLTALINNILDFSRIEAGRKEYEFRDTDIAVLVHNTLDSYRYQIEQQGFAFAEEIDTDLPAVRVDREAIARALVNLVNNALKYSAEEKFLGVKLYRENGVVKLEVADHGIGIERRDQTKIFEKFYRAGDPLVHNTKGSGLGLSLVRHISQAHGGDIVVESAPGRGSTFIMSLPVAAGTQHAGLIQ